jgi:hypothetical protein
MPKTKISEFSATPANNTDIDSINIAEGCSPSGINDAIRELMAQLKDWQSGTSNDPYVVGSSGSLTLNQGTANGVAYLNGSKVVTSGSSLVFDGTNLGVGTASPASKLSIYGTSGDSAITFFGSAGTPVGYMGSTTAGNYIIGALANETFIRSSVGTAFSSDNGASVQMRLNTSGNLGIGVASPAYKLDVNGTAGISGNVTLSGGTANGVAYLNGSKVVTSGSALTFDGTNFAVGTQGEIRAYNTANTRYGRFVTTSDGTILESFNGAGEPLILSAPQSSAYIGFKVNAAEGMRLTSTGLGIGTSSPASKLTVYGGEVQWGASSSLGFLGYTGGFPIIGSLGALPLAFYTNGSEKMRLDSSGNLGLGVTPSAWASAKAMQIGATYSLGLSSFGDDSNMTTNAYYNSAGNWVYQNTASTYKPTRYNQFLGSHIWSTAAATGTAGSTITWTQAMTLDASGRLLVGTTTSSGNIATFKGSQQSFIIRNGVDSDYNEFGVWDGASDGLKAVIKAEGGVGKFGTRTNSAMAFQTNDTERARIDSSGMLAVNYTSTISGGLLVVSSNGVKQSLLVKNDDSVQLYSLGTGTVYSNAGVLTSTNPSDARLKTDVQDLNWGLSQVLALRPVSYAWKNNQINQGTQYGFIAQEVQTVMPDLVREFETKDGEETVTRFGLEKDGIYAAMVKAIQEQQAIIDSLKARLDAANL